METSERLRRNLELGKGLNDRVRWAYEAWVSECFAHNLVFDVRETYRTQTRQNQLYNQGRTTPGKIVTWTRMSHHTQGEAADCYPVNCTHAQLTEMARPYGITHPLPKQDPPHYQFDEVKPPPQPPISPEARIKGLERRLENEKDPEVKATIERMLERMKARLNLSSPIPV